MKLMTKDNLENMIDAGCIDEADRDEILKWKEDSEQWKIYLDGGMNNLFEIHERIEKRVKELRYELDHTNPDYKRSLALQEALQEMVNLIGFEKYEEIMVGKK